MSIYKRANTYHTDVTVNGIRYRESLDTPNWQEAQRRQKELIAKILEGKAASPAGKGSVASLTLEAALDQFVKSREGRVAERTTQIDKERSKVLKRLLSRSIVRKIDAAVIRKYQDTRTAEGVKGRTVNLEVTLIRQILKRAKRWHAVADEVSNLPENENVVGRVLTQEGKLDLFRKAASKPEWMVVYCAAVVAVNTTCRKIELLNLRWSNLDLVNRLLSIQRSKNESGRRTIPLNGEAMEALARLRQRTEACGGGESHHYVFPACENRRIDFTKHQKTFRTAWRKLTVAAGVKGFRFHDLRHQSITEMGEAGIPEAAMQSIAGHLSKKMLDHYSHVRIEAKRRAVEALGGGGLIATEPTYHPGASSFMS